MYKLFAAALLRKTIFQSIITILSVVIFTESAHAVNTEKYFPVKLGATWELEEKQMDNSPYTVEPPPLRYSTGIVAMDDLTSGNFKWTTTRPNSASFTAHRKDPYKGIMALGTAEVNECSFAVPAGTKFLPLHMRIGQEFRTYMSFACPEKSGTSEMRTKMVGMETVAVPAGTYRAMVVERKEYVSGTKTIDEKILFGKGVGVVKIESISEIPFSVPFTPDGILRTVTTTQLLATNLIVEDQEDDEDDCDCAESATGVRLNYSTGTTTIYEDDIAATAYSSSFFRRTFKGNSGIDDGTLGAGWSHNYARRASVVSYASLGGPEYIHLYRENGTVIQFSNSNGYWTSETDLKGKLAVVRQGTSIHTISYHASNDDIELYDATGKLLSITHLGGWQRN